jgi:hypothetical protein
MHQVLLLREIQRSANRVVPLSLDRQPSSVERLVEQSLRFLD